MAPAPLAQVCQVLRAGDKVGEAGREGHGMGTQPDSGFPLVARPRCGESPRPPHPGGVATAHTPTTNCCSSRPGGTKCAHPGGPGGAGPWGGWADLHPPPPRSALASARDTLTGVTRSGTRSHRAGSQERLQQHRGSRAAPAPLLTARWAPSHGQPHLPHRAPTRGTPACRDRGSRRRPLAHGCPGQMWPRTCGLCGSPPALRCQHHPPRRWREATRGRTRAVPSCSLPG